MKQKYHFFLDQVTLEDILNLDVFSFGKWRFNGGNSYSEYRILWFRLNVYHGEPREPFKAQIKTKDEK